MRAWTRPGDPLRILCREPCPVDDATVRAMYAGMLSVRVSLVATVGVEMLPALAPVDVHVSADEACGAFSAQIAGTATVDPGGRVRLCLFSWENSTRPPPYVWCPLDPVHAGMPGQLVLFVHEYAHALFFGRHEWSYEGVAAAISYYVSGSSDSACDSSFARLPYELCRGAGFEWSDLAPAMQALETLYQAGQGEGRRGLGADPLLRPTSSGQLRMTLDAVLGVPTLDAFLAAGDPWYPYLRVAATLPSAGGRVLFYPNVAVDLEPGAVAVDVESRSAPIYRISSWLPPAWATLALTNGMDFGASADFQAPVRLTLRYDPLYLPEGANPATLWIWTVAPDGASAPLAAGTVDQMAHTVSAPIPRLGAFVVGPPPG